MVNHDIVLSSPQHLSKEIWHDLHHISTAAYSDALVRPLEQVEHLTLAEDFDQFYEQQQDPNARLEPGSAQQYYDPHVAVAYYHGQPVGYAYAANNTSGESQSVRQAKYRSVTQRHFWIGNLVVSPEHRDTLRSIAQSTQTPQERVGVLLLRKILSSTNRMQPVSAYVYAEEFKLGKNAIQPLLLQTGMHEAGDQLVDAFGTGQADAKLTHHKADLAWIARYKVTQVPHLHTLANT